MPNSLFSALNGTQNSTVPQKISNPMQMISEFAKFKQSMQGKDPEAIVNELLASGKMSQQQFEQLKQQASALMSILK